MASSGGASTGGGVEGPTNSLVTPLLTDMYQISMAYAYWRSGRHNDEATFELFFRKCPFKGEYVVFAGLDQVMRFIRSFKFTQDDVDYLRTKIPSLKDCDPGFFDYLLTLDCSQMRVDALPEGTIAFPRVTMIKVQGPLIMGQLLETTLLNLVNYPSLIATNATRMRLAAGDNKTLFEFGLRRAQGPDGAISASRYAYVGGFNGTSNVIAGKLTGIEVTGTHAHAFVQSYTGLEDIKDPILDGVDVVARALELRQTDPCFLETNTSELAAFLGYALCFPRSFLALVDTYDTLTSGVPNFILVSKVLHELGYNTLGIRLDSGDLAYLSQQARQLINRMADVLDCPPLRTAKIVASNDIDEHVLLSLKEQKHQIDVFGIGTNLVTCKSQPALGCVYKLVEINGNARIKLSQDIEKVMIPKNKSIFRLFSAEGPAILDLVVTDDEEPPKAGVKVLCRHPFQENRRANVTPARVQRLLECIWNGPEGFEAVIPDLEVARQYAMDQVKTIRADTIRPLNPTPYKVSVSQKLYGFLHDLWLQEMPIQDLQ
eukprot:CAMPEP_0118980012 /NCGR_PEP_ID=MMETSP1173-20130426/27292_1 /TAXON_ID=1034831 /ORGANISM="Rhizochromulina marina cf, Strain CCMP1243" /LENGTH=543 /DNA_ID=CAMNT_0006930323 /DNA_START=130 /DNA_END=1761 /DNA_ORIENTATION=+